jgi:Na+-translocating ferredoxin:NAD+ oxidoreductase RnfC subunit
MAMLKKRLDLQRFEHPAPYQASEIGPDRVVVRHQQHAGEMARPVCEPGQVLSQGELLADLPPAALGVPVHASLTGTVVEVTPTATVIERRL